VTIPDALLVRLVASFFAGFAIVAIVTALADTFGEGPAGFVGGLPSAGAVGLLSIGLTQSPSAAIQATTLFPLAFSITLAFLLFYTIPERLEFQVRMSVALFLWFLASVAVAIWGPDDFVLSLVGGIVVSLAVLFARGRVLTKKNNRVAPEFSWQRMMMRGALGGTVVVAVAILSVVSGPLVGGVFAAAPVIWSSSLYVTSRAQGVEFSRSLTKTFMQTGILTVIPYAVAARYLFSVFGIWLGTLLAYVVITPLAFVAWRLANRKAEG
jgi:uncharacterized membrane protein (GlpM family)